MGTGMSDSISKTIADSEELLQITARERKSVAEALNKILGSHLGWPYRVRAGSAKDVDGLAAGEFPTLIYTATETEVPPEPVSVSAESLAGVVEIIPSLDSAGLRAAYEKIAIAKSLRRTSAPPSPYLNTTLGIIFALESPLSLEDLGQRLDELNKAHPSHLWADMVVVLGKGALHYAVQFPGEPISGDFLLPGKNIGFGAPMYIHLFARPGKLALNRMCSILFMHAALFSPGVKLPDREATLIGVPQAGMTLAGYQSNSKGLLVPASADHYQGGTAFRHPLLRIEDQRGTLLSHLQFIPWQDGAVVRLHGKLPLEGLLVFLGSVAAKGLIIKRPDGQYAGVLPITENDFGQMVTRIQKQSNMVVRPEPQPTWIISKAYDEGTASPFMARLFLGVLKIREQLYGSDRKKRDDFDRTYESVLVNLHSARAAAKEIRDLVQYHRSEISQGTCVIKTGTVIRVEKNIYPELRKQTETFLNSAGRALKNVQDVMRLLGLDIAFLYQKPGSFQRGLAKLTQTDRNLGAYLDETRAKWSERLTKARNALEHEGWALPRVMYQESQGVLTMIEPTVDGEPVSSFADTILERLSCFVEEVVVHGLQQQMLEGISLTELPLAQRRGEAPERFQPAIVTGGSVIWRITYHGRRFDEI
jgi:hypothetical protein